MPWHTVLQKLKLYSLGLLALAALLALLAWALWRDRLPVDTLAASPPPEQLRAADTVIATWLGTSTLLFDDGETQLLIDGYFSRPPLSHLLTGRPVESDAAAVNLALERYGITRLSAIIPSHAHFDHALDIGAVANRTEAVIFGSPSAARIARGAGVPEEQLSIVTEKTSRDFGRFTVTLIPSVHAPIGFGHSVPFEGDIGSPLAQPAPISEFRVGTTFAIVVEHPQGTSLINSSAGYVADSLLDVDADVVFLGTGLLSRLDEDYSREYWIQTVTASGAGDVLIVHFDDYTKPLGDTLLMPRALDSMPRTLEWLAAVRDLYDPDVTIRRPVFGRAMVLYPEDTGT